MTLITIRYHNGRGRRRVLRCVAKKLTGRPMREADAYEKLAAIHANGFAPRLLGIDRSMSNSATIYVEAINQSCAWPWRELSPGRVLLQRLARFHAAAGHAAAAVPEWDYEIDLAAAAAASLRALAACRRDSDLAEAGGGMAAVTRIVRALPEVRRQLLADATFGRGPIHGDVHTANVLVHRADGPVLIDWGRTRICSPLEDVSSWLQSLGYLVPEARQRHDTLFALYLSSRGLEQKLSPDVRAAYWLAGASNALAGALLHHIRIAADRRHTRRRRAAAVLAARDWLRVIRRADAWWS